MPDITQLSETKRALFEKYKRGARSQVATPVDAIPRRREEGPAPLSFGQQQMWLLAQLIPDTPVYNESVTLRLPGSLNVPALEHSLNAFIERHSAWRTSFPLLNGQPVQQIHPPFHLALPEIDLRHLPEAEREPEAIRLATEQAWPLFDLAKVPLLRPMLVHLSDDDHRLYLTLHHIIFDGTIYEIFLPELRAGYEAFLEGKQAALPPLPLQYVDFAVWQRERLQGHLLNEQLAYWKRQLANAPDLLELPADRPRPPVLSYHGAKLPFKLSDELNRGLKALARREGITLYMLLVATFKTLLYRYTGQQDLLIASTTGGRNHRDVQGLIGLFVNTLVLRTDMSGNPTFRELLARVRNVILEAHAHQDVPFEYVVKEVQPERNLARNPLVQISLSLEPPLPVLPSGWTITQSDVDIHTTKFDIYLELDDRPDGFDAWLEYNTDLFDLATAERMVKHWCHLLESVVADPTQRIDDLPLLTPAEYKQIVVDWNETQRPYPDQACLHQLIEEQVEQTPDATALIFEGQRRSYRELNHEANQLAHRLQAAGVGPEVMVGVCMERSIEMVVALLAVLKAGGAYVPLDPTYPHERLTYMLEDAGVPVLLTQSSVLKRLPGLEVSTVICVDPGWNAESTERTDNPASAVSPDNLVYMIYTSGSSGRPKGALNTHRALCNRLTWMQETYQLTGEDRVLQKTPFSFDVSVWEFFWPLLAGASLVIARPEGHKDPSYLAEIVAEQRITTLHFVPSMLQAFLLVPDLRRCASLRQVICSGEALPLELQERFFASFPAPVQLHNLYGPTEAAIDVTFWECRRGDTQAPVPIGRPIANTRIYILDAARQPVPVGVPGELYIGGVALARGYHRRPELTAEKFVSDPFSSDPQARLYRTGDLARYRADGAIEYLGRIDQQVKLRGFRIELGEIEEVLRQLSLVKDVAVIAREDTPGDKRLVAYIVAAATERPSVADLRAALQKKLPEYMVPAAFVFLDALPLTHNGKLDRRALPVPDLDRGAADDTFAEPTQIEHYQLLAIWEELLSVRPIGIRDNFFYLGGHSLLATRLVARIEQVFGQKISLPTLFAGPTIEQLAIALRSKETTRPRSPLLPVQTAGSQQPFFFLHGDWTGGSFYCFTLARQAGPDQPFYALEPFTFSSDQPLPSIETLAASYLTYVRSVQPHGPYLLGGYCNGGLLAYEMARQLYAQGETVDLLALVNPSSPKENKNIVDVIDGLGNLLRLSEDARSTLFLRFRHAARYIYARLWPNSPRLSDLAKLLALDPQLTRMFPAKTALRKDYVGCFSWIVSHYLLRFYPGAITLFWSNEDPLLGTTIAQWQRDSTAVQQETYMLSGPMGALRTENSHILAEHISRSLQHVLSSAAFLDKQRRVNRN